MKFKNCILVSKEISGSYNKRIMFEGEDYSLKSDFVATCMKYKKETGLMQQSENSFEFLDTDKLKILNFSLKVSEELNIPLVIL